jgi:hypothetical protein
VGLHKRSQRTGLQDGAEGVDTASGAERVRPLLASLPQKWVKVSRVEGQGWVLYVPCYSGNGQVSMRSAPDSLPGLTCDFCDSLDSYSVPGILRNRRDSSWQVRLDPPAGEVRILPVNESLLQAFPEAPFKDRILLWTRSLAGGRSDTMVFVPKTLETEFETLRAEDESPEGCGEAQPD